MDRLREFRDYGLASALLLGAWWYASGPGGLPPYLLPSPTSTIRALAERFIDGSLWTHLAFTLRTILLGLVLGSAAGIALACMLHRLPRLATWLDGPLVVAQTAPKIALAPLFVVWFGLGITSKLILVFSLVFFPVLVGSLAGLRAIDPRMHDYARLLNLGTLERLWRIDLIAALPGIFIGLRIGAVQALVGAILSEWMAGSRGLGHLMTYASATYETALLYGAVLLTTILGVLLHVGLLLAETRFLSWKDGDA